MYTTLPLFPDVSFLKNVSLFSMPCFKKKKKNNIPEFFLELVQSLMVSENKASIFI